MIICVGEILYDCYVNKQNVSGDLTINAHPGGAPYNVACNLTYLGDKVCFIGNVGNDIFGKELIKHALSMNFHHISILKKFNTTLALVSLDENNERNFSFIRKNGADFRFKKLPFKVVNKAKIVHFGSLMLSAKEGRNFILKELKLLKKSNVFLTFDVNYRNEIFTSQINAKNFYLKILPYFNLVKLSENEVFFLTNLNDIDAGVKMLKKDFQIYIVTLSDKGSKLYYQDKIYFENSKKVNVVDTTGAGDAFLSGVLHYINNKDIRYNGEYFHNLLEYANCLGAFSVTHEGAISNKISNYSIK